MLLRAYRLTDKLGLLLLKSLTALSTLVVDGVLVVLGSAVGQRSGLLGLIALLFSGVLRLLMLGVGVVRTLLGLVARLLGGTTAVAASATMRLSGQTTQAARAGSQRAMARRSARAELDTGIAPDPLITQNRFLSALVVLALAGLVGVVLWATRPTPAPVSLPLGVDVSLQGGGAALAATEQPAQSEAPLAPPTAIPTATQVPEVLQARGSIAYTVRENGQTDLWALNVTSRVPIRITNDLADERDPAWSPDGRRLAYASNKDGNWEIYIYDLQTGETRRMTFNLAFEGAPSWSPDGNFLAYETYQNGNLDIYVLPVTDVNATLQPVTQEASPDFSPAWSPLGRQIAFVSWRDGSQDIHIFSLDTFETINITNTPDRDEDFPAWHPDGDLIAYSAVDRGVEKVFVKSVSNPGAPAQPIGAGRQPAWSPDGSSIVAAVDTVDSTHLTVYPYANPGAPPQFFQVKLGAGSPSWSSEPLPAALVNSGGLPLRAEPLYIEQETQLASGLYTLGPLPEVSVSPNAQLSVRVDDSFNALRRRTLAASGRDFLASLESAFWGLDVRPQAGEEQRNWHYTGRAFSINRNTALAGLPVLVEVVREERGLDIVWRLYLRVDDNAAGQLGEPLRRMPWDFNARTSGDVEAYNQGGRLKTAMPSGYFIDLTALAADYGWQPMPAGMTWRANFNAVNYWMFYKSGGLSWLDAMLEIYQPPQLGGFMPTPTPFPPATTDETGS